MDDNICENGDRCAQDAHKLRQIQEDFCETSGAEYRETWTQADVKDEEALSPPAASSLRDTWASPRDNDKHRSLVVAEALLPDGSREGRPSATSSKERSYTLWLSQVWATHTNLLSQGESPGDSVAFYTWLARVLRVFIVFCGGMLAIYCVSCLLSMERDAQRLDDQLNGMLGSVQNVPCLRDQRAPPAGVVYLKNCKARSADAEPMKLDFPGFEALLGDYAGRHVLWRRLRVWRLRKSRGILTDLSAHRRSYDDDPLWRREEITNAGNLSARFDAARVELGPYVLSADAVAELPGQRLHLERNSKVYISNSSSGALITLSVVTYPYSESGHHFQGTELRTQDPSDEDAMIAVGFEAAFDDSFSVFGYVPERSLSLGAVNARRAVHEHYNTRFEATAGTVPLDELLHVEMQAHGRAILVQCGRILAGLACGFGLWAVLWPDHAGHFCCKEFFKYSTVVSFRHLALALPLGAVSMLLGQLPVWLRVAIVVGVLASIRGLTLLCYYQGKAGTAQLPSGESHYGAPQDAILSRTDHTVFHVII
eukprot:TRINITY_DN77943_c0_g1_i1.p1 TRINITY_DN77943_c0_g1~~TRINITY_DN77943_c0_g1_i1.p1  ORF type:complete len:575 (+),score=69.16 TRINITY_DN77943_c0_g1_i1:106-1725(+)